MFNKNKVSYVLGRTLLLLGIPMLLSSTGYALFSKQLSVSATATKPAYTRSQSLSISYTKTITPSAGKFNYVIPVTIKNDGTNGVTAWRSEFSLPGDFSAVNCGSSTSCTQPASNNVAVSGTNGTIAPGASVSYTLSFTTSNPNYLFTNIVISGTPAPIYESIAGLTFGQTRGTRTKSGNIFSWPYTFTITNNSGQNLAGWRVQCPWSTTNTVSSMANTVDFTTTSTQLSIFSKQAINNATSFQFTGTLTSTNQNYVLSGCVVQRLV